MGTSADTRRGVMVRPNTSKVLFESGWTPGRRIQTDSAESALINEGYPIWTSLLEFISSYDGLALQFTRGEHQSNAWFGFDRVIATTSKEWIEEYQMRTGLSLTPIGRAYGDHLVLLSAADGSFFGGYDNELFLLGKNVDDMLDTLVSGVGFEEVE
jgi:hypothetical protein